MRSLQIRLQVGQLGVSDLFVDQKTRQNAADYGYEPVSDRLKGMTSCFFDFEPC